jgi:hypothetical protein
MKESVLQLQVFYEIAMALGNSLDLNEMLQESLTVYLRKLNCSAGAILMMTEQYKTFYQFTPVFSIPREIKKNETYRHAMKRIPDSLPKIQLPRFLKYFPIHGNLGEKKFFHLMELPDFGILLLVKSSIDLEQPVLRSLTYLNEKLARSCNACLQNKKLAQHIEHLKNEIFQRHRIEDTLRDNEKRLQRLDQHLTEILENVAGVARETGQGKDKRKWLKAIEDAALKARNLT